VVFTDWEVELDVVVGSTARKLDRDAVDSAEKRQCGKATVRMTEPDRKWNRHE
jgi:hypothetical protein